MIPKRIVWAPLAWDAGIGGTPIVVGLDAATGEDVALVAGYHDEADPDRQGWTAAYRGVKVMDDAGRVMVFVDSCGAIDALEERFGLSSPTFVDV